MSSVGESIKEQAAEIAAPAAEKAREMAEDKAREIAAEKKAAGADRLDAVARAVHGAADQLEPQLPPLAADYIHEAANGIERASSMIRERSIDDLLRLAGNFARQQPAAFFGGAVLAGFALSRFLKSSADAGPRAEPVSAYDPDATGGTAYGIPQSGTSTGGVD